MVTSKYFPARPMEDIHPYPYNNKIHPPSQLQKIKKIVLQVGFLSPLILDEDGYILAGHGAFGGGKLAGMLAFPCLVHTGLSEEQKRAFRIADNKLAEDSIWDYGNLTAELVHLHEAEFDISSIGYSDAEIKKLLENNVADLIDDEPPIVVGAHKRSRKKKTEGAVAVPGDVFSFGGIEIHCKDDKAAAQIDWIIRRLQAQFDDIAIHSSGKTFNELGDARKG